MFKETNNYTEVAQFYEKAEIKDTAYLAYRDIPKILTCCYKNHFPVNALDFGCGTGRSTRFLKSLGINKVTGVDKSPIMLEHAKANKKYDIEYTHINNNYLPFKDNSFDYVLSVFVMLEVSDLKEMATIFKAIHNVLKPGCFFTFVTSSEKMFNHEWLSLTTTYTKEQTFYNGQKLNVYLKNIDQVLTDYYWDNKTYIKILEDTEFEVTYIHHPLGSEGDPYNWKDEKFVSPYSIFTVQKK